MITNKQIVLLTEAVDEAEAWRGSLVGHPDYRVLIDFDRRVAEMRAALDQVVADRKLLKRLMKLPGAADVAGGVTWRGGEKS